MSRGIGRMQREALLVLWNDEESRAAGMPHTELKRRISTDRSNARRAIRGLIERGLLQEVADEEEGERRVKLTGGAHLALFLASYPDGEALPLERVPGRPVVLDPGDGLDDDPMKLGIPHGASLLLPVRPVSDHGLISGRPTGDAMQSRMSHANEGVSPDPAVSDNGARSGSTVLEMIARMARERLEHLGEGVGEEEA